MCGIAGIFDLTGQREPDRELLAAMNQTQFHRGPDEGGLHTEPGVGLAHRRLSIIDLASGQQPMFSADGNLCVSYNGEIYNFRELMQELRGLGYEFRTHCDTEVLLAAFVRLGLSETLSCLSSSAASVPPPSTPQCLTCPRLRRTSGLAPRRRCSWRAGVLRWCSRSSTSFRLRRKASSILAP